MNVRGIAVCTDGLTDGHELATHEALARYLAEALNLDFTADRSTRASGICLVPQQTLIGENEKRRFSIEGEDDLFGGWVPHDWMATKAIAHDLVEEDRGGLEDFDGRFADRAGHLTLKGYVACSRDGMRRACRSILERCGSVRLKPIHANGSRDQQVVQNVSEVDAWLERQASEEVLRDPVVIEENLEDVITYSLGTASVAGRTIAYCGSQYLTHDNQDGTAYGGSDLLVANGGWEALLELPLDASRREAVLLARDFDRLAGTFLPTFVASRRNYDVALGRGRLGARRLGVLEQSWRIGGASGAEIAALAAFAREPDKVSVHASTVERYGSGEEPPSEARIIYAGEDPTVGPLLKYVTVEDNLDAGEEVPVGSGAVRA